MIQTQSIAIADKQYIHAWSDDGFMIERDGILYEDAIDPADSERIYTETDQRITYTPCYSESNPSFNL